MSPRNECISEELFLCIFTFGVCGGRFISRVARFVLIFYVWSKSIHLINDPNNTQWRVFWPALLLEDRNEPTNDNSFMNHDAIDLQVTRSRSCTIVFFELKFAMQIHSNYFEYSQFWILCSVESRLPIDVVRSPTPPNSNWLKPLWFVYPFD